MANRTQGHNPSGNPRSGTSNRGFASMGEEQQRAIARMGGEAVSEDRGHMAEIGRKGGEASAESRANQRSARARAAETTAETTGLLADRDIAADTRGRKDGKELRGDGLDRGLDALDRDDDRDTAGGNRGRDH